MKCIEMLSILIVFQVVSHDSKIIHEKHGIIADLHQRETTESQGRQEWGNFSSSRGSSWSEIRQCPYVFHISSLGARG